MVGRLLDVTTLAFDSDDEKRLSKSRTQAVLNKKETRSNRLKPRKRFNNDANKNNIFSRSPTSTTISYFSGKEGHLQYNCPDRRNSFFNKRR